MADPVEGGATLAWRILATLEGGSVLLAATALLAYTLRKNIKLQNQCRRTVRTVLVTNTTSLLGRELKRSLEVHGCIVETVSDVTSEAGSGATSRAVERVDAVVIVGVEPDTHSLEGIANFVTQDIYNNLSLLDLVSSRIHNGGYIAWACATHDDATPGTFSDAAAAFDTVLRASLLHSAKLHQCNPLWIGRCESIEQATQRTVTSLLRCNMEQAPKFSLRNTFHHIGEFFDKWMKIVR